MRYALLIGMLLAIAAASAYPGAGYNRNYWFAGNSLGNGIDRFGYGAYDSLPLRYGGGAYDWQQSYAESPRFNARYGSGVVSPRYGYGVVSPRYGYQFQTPRARYPAYWY